MPLTKFQAQLARLLAVNRTIDSHLAGGAALNFEPQSIRYSNDLDYFHDSEQRVASAFAEDQILLIENNYQMSIEMKQPGFIRTIVSKEKEATKIEWAHDSAWRFMPVQYAEDRGYYLHAVDLATNKILALAGRDEARDYLDIHDIHNRILSVGALCWASCAKDPGFTPISLLQLLRRRGKYRIEDFNRLKLNIKIDLELLKTSWLKILDEAEIFIKNRPSTEAGCLYYSQQKKSFVSPGSNCDTSDIIPHYGVLGGVLPKIVDL